MRSTYTLDGRCGLNGVIADLGTMLAETTDDLAVATQLAAVVKEAEHLVGLHVRSAIREGATWQQVGDALGVSRQAAHKRYSL